MKKIILLSDTHHCLDKRFFPHFNKADEIWHAGDIGNISITDQLRKFGYLRAVWGNIDNKKIRIEFKKTLFFKCEEVNVMMTHIGGYPGRYSRRVSDCLKSEKVDLFICGHSHILKVINDKKHNLLHINPGAIGKYGFHNKRTMVRFDINGKKIENLEIIEFNR